MAAVQAYPQAQPFGNDPSENPFADPDHPQNKLRQDSAVLSEKTYASEPGSLASAALQDPAVWTLHPANALRSSYRIVDSANNTRYLCKIHRSATRFTIHEGDNGDSTALMTAVFHTFSGKKLYLGDPSKNPNCPVADIEQSAFLHAKSHTLIVPTTGRELIWTKAPGEHGLASSKFGPTGRLLRDEKTGEDLAVWYHDKRVVFGSGSHGRFKFLKSLTKEEEMSSLLVHFGSMAYRGYINSCGTV